MTTAGIRAGRAFVEIGTNSKNLEKGLAAAEQRMTMFANKIAGIGLKLTAIGAAMSIPFVIGAKAFADVEQQLANLASISSPTQEQFESIRETMDRLSKSTSQGPADVVRAMGELVRAGMDLDMVLSGAAESAIKFARVGEMDVADAAITMADALNVFHKDALSASQVVDTLAAAAASSSINIRQIAWSFQMSSAVYGLAGQTLKDLSTAIAILGNAGLKGSDAGTSLKSMMLALLAPTDDAQNQMDMLGMSVRDATTGEMLPMAEIVRQLAASFEGLDAASRDIALKKIFGTDAIRAASILSSQGTKGWEEMSEKIGSATTVAEKFEVVMDTLQGAFRGVVAAITRTSVAIGEALNKPLRAVAEVILNAADMMTYFLERNAELIQRIALSSVIVAALGGALIGLSMTIRVVTFAFSGLSVAMAVLNGLAVVTAGLLTALVSPIGLLIGSVAVLGGTFLYHSGMIGDALGWLSQRFEELKSRAGESLSAISTAMSNGNVPAAARVLWAALSYEWEKGKAFVLGIWYSMQDALVSYSIDAWAAIKMMALNAFKIIADEWDMLVAGMINALSTALDFFTKMFSKLNETVEKIVAYTMGILFNESIGSVLPEINQMITTEHEEYRRQIDRTGEASRSRREDETAQRMLERSLEIQSDDSIVKEMMESQQALRELSAERTAQSAKDVADAAEEWRKSIEAANQKAAELIQPEMPERKAPDFSGLVDIQDQLSKNVSEKIDIGGTFDTSALDRMGFGTDIQKQQLKVQERMLGELAKIQSNTSDMGIEFA